MRAHESDPGAARGLGLRRHGARREAGTPMRVLALDPAGRSIARCAGVDGIPATVATMLIEPLEPGAIVLVHGGVALARLDAEWAL